MAKINYVKLYKDLQKEKKKLTNDETKPNQTAKISIPEDFNQSGWDLTKDAVIELLTKLTEFEQVKEKRMTPQFYKAVYNRSLVASQEIDKVLERIKVEEIEDYEQACLELMAEIKELKETNNTEDSENDQN